VTVVGIRCTKNSLDWVVIDGADRVSATELERNKALAPAGDRGAQLAWVRQEVLELLDRHQVDVVALRVNETGGQSISLDRSEVEGVVQEAVYSRGITCRRLYGATVRGAFKARTAADAETAAAQISVVAAVPKTRREPVVAAVAAMPG
jgi:hypothetical protein